MAVEKEKILDWVPIRKPMLCIDGICDIDYGQSVRGYREINKDEGWAKGHFINEPVFPGTLIIETMAQIGSFMFYDEKNAKNMKAYLGKVDSVKFMKKVIPDCRMYINGRLIIQVGNMARIKCEAVVNEEVVARGEVTLFYVEEPVASDD